MTPVAARSRTSSTKRSKGREISGPRTAGTMQNAQLLSQPIWMVDLARASAATKASAAVEAAEAPLHADTGPTEVSLTAEELATASGLTREQLRDLERFGLLAGKSLGDAVYYDGDALLVATKAAGFLGHGVEARHLRMFKVAAEREAGFLEQLAMPLLKQRNPQARFMGGAWVFPGGAVDAHEGEGAAAHRAAAVRELAEEAAIEGVEASQLVPFSRWITPPEVKIRFDTHFFLARLPQGAVPRVDIGMWFINNERVGVRRAHAG